MNHKLVVLKRYSDINEVNRRARSLGLNEVHPSSNARKKYMIFDGHKMIHFGSSNYEDYTKHHDEKRRMNFNKRNWKWANAPAYSPSWLSYWLLWN